MSSLSLRRVNRFGWTFAVSLREPLISPVISAEEERGVWSSNTKQKKSPQVEQEGGFRARSDISEDPGKQPEFVFRRKKFNPRPETFSSLFQEGEAAQLVPEMRSGSDITMTKTRRGQETARRPRPDRDSAVRIFTGLLMRITRLNSRGSEARRRTAGGFQGWKTESEVSRGARGDLKLRRRHVLVQNLQGPVNKKANPADK